MSAPKEILDLVERFNRNREEYQSGKYNETQLRQEFLNPFFKVLGWDVTNEKGYSEAYKEVIHEDAIKIGAATKAPDYCFRIGGTRKFFVEAKKPSINIKDDFNPAFQLRRYAWSAKLPLSILTDFEEFAVYDCRIKPHKTDKPTTGRNLYFTFDQYSEKWDEIANIFSQDAVLKGSFDKFADSGKGKKGTTTVDEAFLEEIEKWRKELAKNIAVRNSKLTVQELNYSVQKIIDRIIFLRICEDRRIEQYGRLLSLINGVKVYDRLTQIFQRADERYNSGLFHFQKEKDRPEQPDELTLDLKINDKVFQDMIGGLYYPESPYEFSALPADILGQVYEQFLGKVIRLTEGHQAKVEDKPEVKKAGGVFYTPTYIVEYIVKNTVGKLCENKIPKQVSKLRILDPACGSGSFLIGAYQYLLDWHRDWYVNDSPQNHTKELYQGPGSDWKLTTDTRKRILLNNIYGVDIDPQAVEVTKLSLLLKVLEGESDQTLKKQLEIFHQRALPDLGSNIKCGNSLIGADYFSGQLLADMNEIRKVNPFNWEKEFPVVLENGGFDAVIGNPPYVRQEELKDIKKYLSSNYITYQSTADLYVNFVEKGHKLLKTSGLFGMIISNKWLRAAYGKPLREFLQAKVSLLQIVDLAGLPVFQNATVRTIVLISDKKEKSGNFLYLAPLSDEEFKKVQSGDDLQKFFDKKTIQLLTSNLTPDSWSFSGNQSNKLIENIKGKSVTLDRYLNGKAYRGILTGFNKAFVIDVKTKNNLVSKNKNSKEIIKPLLGGRDIRRYLVEYDNKFLILTPVGILIDNYPAVFEYLKQFKNELENRWDKGNHWWELRHCDYYELFEKPKIIYPDIATSCRFALDLEGFFSTNTTYFIPGNDLFLLGLLNSKLGQYYFSTVCAGLEGKNETYLRFFGQYLEGFPVFNLESLKNEEKEIPKSISEFVKKINELKKKGSVLKDSNDKQILQRQINQTDKEIDDLVYKIYGLSPQEIKIIESETKN